MNGNRLVYRADSCPKEPYDELGVEVESPGRTDGFHDADSGLERVQPKAEERIVYAAPEGFKVGEPVSDAAPLHSFRRGIRSKHRHSEDHRVRVIA